jgi:hypothetical protein
MADAGGRYCRTGLPNSGGKFAVKSVPVWVWSAKAARGDGGFYEVPTFLDVGNKTSPRIDP